jgi:hypothetical protein
MFEDPLTQLWTGVICVVAVAMSVTQVRRHQTATHLQQHKTQHSLHPSTLPKFLAFSLFGKTNGKARDHGEYWRGVDRSGEE